jgi:large repetitive protein
MKRSRLLSGSTWTNSRPYGVSYGSLVPPGGCPAASRSGHGQRDDRDIQEQTHYDGGAETTEFAWQEETVTSLPWARRGRLASAIAAGILATTLGPPAASAAAAASAHGLGPPNTWVATGPMDAARAGQTATMLPGGKILVAGGGPASAALYSPATRTFTATGRMPVAVAYATATLLPGGKVLVAGGRRGGHQVASAELYNPASGTWSVTGSMKAPRSGQTATLLPDGQVLVTGGGCNGGLAVCSPDTSLSTLASAELYNPATGTWRFTGGTDTGREYQTATLLPGGEVLVAGGLSSCDEGVCTDARSAELYHPSTGRFTATGSMHTVREQHTATLLRDGDVLVAGGLSRPGYGPGGGTSTDAELYHPATGTWSRAAPMAAPHAGQTATLLRNGWVLMAGGQTRVAEIYEPQRAIWVTAGSMTTVRSHQTATLLPTGHVLVTGGDGPDNVPQSTAEEFLAGRGPLVNITPASIAFGGQQVGTASRARSYQVTNDGSADLVAAGVALTGPHPGDFRAATNCARAPVPPGGTCTVRVSFAPTFTGLRKAAAVVSGNAPGPPREVGVDGFGGGPDAWVPVGSMITPRDNFTATLLPDGKVLVAGGQNNPSHSLASAELYNPATRTFCATGALHTARSSAAATLLPDGQVLVAGGMGNLANLASAELYNPATGRWHLTTPMHAAGYGTTSTLLPDGKVLVAGLGFGSTAEVYDPAKRTWTDTGPMTASQFFGTATLLRDGKVLVTGGGRAAAELYDPATNRWTATGPLRVTQISPTATLLGDGEVLLAGGVTPGANGKALATAELYNPGTGTWSLTESMDPGRGGATTTLLPDGSVLEAGGCSGACRGKHALSSAEVFVGGRWFPVGSMTQPRTAQTATLLPGGNVLAAGGDNRPAGTPTATAELYTPTLVAVKPAKGPPGTKVAVSGTGFYAGETVVLALDDKVILGHAKTTASGTFTGTVTIPASTPGRHLLFAVGTRSDAGAIAPFTVTG